MEIGAQAMAQHGDRNFANVFDTDTQKGIALDADTLRSTITESLLTP